MKKAIYSLTTIILLFAIIIFANINNKSKTIQNETTASNETITPSTSNSENNSVTNIDNEDVDVAKVFPKFHIELNQEISNPKLKGYKLSIIELSKVKNFIFSSDKAYTNCIAISVKNTEESKIYFKEYFKVSDNSKITIKEYDYGMLILIELNDLYDNINEINFTYDSENKPYILEEKETIYSP